ncbi:MAG: potassium-transporting ATPase subunit A [Euryarchaeota archaeon]|nr:potassium-transporting ATPase subunit A [Euryarchaeota archaeon]MDE1837671.1 potassium-transporting ATPase subunit A [Euryarchaeota archaeon]MDE1880346.1 potassium-transporting ATPase subunit A [Euryarchaeota archaeon]MDE2046345.1 potassium-transporting ATPase subunit A [Thermoplasmata archaeon]
MSSIYSPWDVGLTFALGLLLARYLGVYMARVFMDRPTLLDNFFAPIERGIYRLLGVQPRRAMGWKEYAASLVLLNAFALVFVLVLLMEQAVLPYNALNAPGMRWDLALHTSTAFTTNTDFQHYSGATALSLLSQLVGLQMLMFLSAVSGLTVVVAFIRGFVRRDGTLGNFWADATRATTRIFFPLAVVSALVLLFLGVTQTMAQATSVPALGGGQRLVPTGPLASWGAIELLGSNGGGYFASNFAYPLQSPTAVTNDVAIVIMMLIPFATPFMFGEMVRRPKEAYPLISAVLTIFLVALGLFFLFEIANPNVARLPVTQAAGYGVMGGETRFSLGEDALFQVTSVYANVGSTTMALQSVTPGAQMVLLWGMFLQDVPGGVGTGFGMLLVNALLSVFVAGLMVGRTPEYLGCKIGRNEMKWAAVSLLSHPFAILVPLAITAAVPGLLTATAGGTSQGFTQVLYEFTSEAANNGSGMGFPVGAGDASVYFNLVGVLIMLLGRFLPIIAMLAIGGALARETTLPPGPGTLRTQSATFTVYFIAFLLVVSGLLFLPVLALGPLSSGVTFP